MVGGPRFPAMKLHPRRTLTALILCAIPLLTAHAGPVTDHYRIGADVALANPPRFSVNAEFGTFAPWNVDQRINAWNNFVNLEPMVQQHHGQCDGGGVDFAQHNTSPRFSFWDCGRSGYWDGAEVRFYRIEDGVMSLVREATVARSVIGNDPVSNAKTEEKIYFTEQGPAIRSGDFYVLRKTFTKPSPNIRPALLDSAWGTNFLLDGYCNFDGRVNWLFDTNTFAPEGGSTASLRMELSEATPEKPSGPWHWFVINNSDEPHIHLRFNPGKSYRARVWLKQEGMSDPRALIQLGCFTSSVVQVGTEWQQYEFNLPVDNPERPLPSRQNSGSRVFIGGFSNGTLWMDNLLIWQTDVEPFAVMPNVVEALKSFHPGTLRLWNGYISPSLEFWLREGAAQLNSGDYGKSSRPVSLSLRQGLNLCLETGADPWLILNPFFTAEEHAQLMEYLAGPADKGYGKVRAQQGRKEPWTTAFKTIHLECANEAWNSIFKANWSGRPDVYAAFADRQFRDLKASPYYDRAKFELIANGWDNNMDVQGWTHRVALASKEADRIDIACYFGGWEKGATPLAGEQGELTDEIYQDKLYGTPIEFGRKMVQSLVMNPDLNQSLCKVLKTRPDLLARGMEQYSSSRVRWTPEQLVPPAAPDTAAAITGLWALDTNLNDSIRSVLAHRRNELERSVWNAAYRALGTDPVLQPLAQEALKVTDAALLPALCDGLADLNAPSRLLPLLKTNQAQIALWREGDFTEGNPLKDLDAFAETGEKLTYNITNELNQRLRKLVLRLAQEQNQLFIAALQKVATADFLRTGLQNLDYSTRGMFFEPGHRRAEQLMLAMKKDPAFATEVIACMSGEVQVFKTAAAQVAAEFGPGMAGIYSGAMTHPSHPDDRLLLRQLPPTVSRSLLQIIRKEMESMLGTFSKESQLCMPAMFAAALGDTAPAEALARNPEVVSILTQQMSGALPHPFLLAAQQDTSFGNELMSKLARNPNPATKGLAVYEGGPGYALPGPNKPPAEDDENLGKSLVMGTATLDAFMQFLSLNVSPLGYYQFKSGSHWASHNNPIDMIPYPSWLALQMVNQQMRGDLMEVETVSGATVDVPDKEIIRTTNDGKGSKSKVAGRANVPLSACYAFRDGTRYTLVLINRDFKAARPVQVDLPASGTKPSQLFSLTHPDPTTHNRSAYNVKVVESEGPVLAKEMKFDVPPASVLVLVGEVAK